MIFSNGGSVLNMSPYGSSIIDAPVVLQDDVVINGSGTVRFNGGITGNRCLKVQAGTITATSICVDTLTIGSGGTAVPEPTSLLLLGLGMFGLLMLGLRRRAK